MNAAPPDFAPEAHFASAYAALEALLKGGRTRVHCALAQPCARPLFNLLLQARRQGLALTVVLPDSPAARDDGNAWERLQVLGAAVHWVGPQALVLHTSVCVVDGLSLASGALPAINPVAREDFVGIVLYTDAVLAAQCASALEMHGCTSAPRTAPDATLPVGEALVVKPAANAGLEPWQAQLLQAQTLALQADIDEVERRLQDFDRQQDASIGPLMRQYLDLKRQYLAKLHAQFDSEEHRSQAQQAHDSFEQYTRSHPVDEPPRREKRLDEDEQRALKQLYRKLAMQCHPDRVGGADKAAAQAWFQRLQKSYQLSDLAGLQRLQTQWALSATPATSAAPDAAADASAPTATPAQAAGPLLAQLDALHTQRLQLLRSPTWRTLASQSNWDLWFSQQASYLQAQVERYQEALQPATDSAP
ncbi:MAG: hypothetical protein WCO17_03640 [Betaproteobacteria bacterium]